MKILQKICFVLLLTTFSSVYGGDCFKDKDVDDCRVRAEQGESWAQFNLGIAYDKGQGDIQDYKESFKWYRLAAEQGLPQAQFNLGLMYGNGEGVLQDYKESVKWYRLAAEQGYADAQYNLGVMYGRGQGVIQDYVMAHMYFNIAAVSGHKDAIKGRGVVENEMTPSQIEKAQDLAMEWEITQVKVEYTADRGGETQRIIVERIQNLLPDLHLWLIFIVLHIARFENQRWVRSRLQGLRGESESFGLFVDLTGLWSGAYSLVFLIAYMVDASILDAIILWVLAEIVCFVYVKLSFLVYIGDSVLMWMIGTISIYPIAYVLFSKVTWFGLF